jgi:hypothetical protein
MQITRMVSGRLHLRVHLADGFLDGAAEIADGHAVFDGHIAGVPFAIDL